MTDARDARPNKHSSLLPTTMAPRPRPSTSAFDPSSSPFPPISTRDHGDNDSPRASKGKQRAEDESPVLFDNISYYLSPSLRTDVRDTIRALMDKNAGTEIEDLEPSPTDSEHIATTLRLAEYIISDSWHLERDILSESLANEMDVDGDKTEKPRMPSIVTVSGFLAEPWNSTRLEG